MEQMNRMDDSDPFPVHGAIYPVLAHYFCSDPAHPESGQVDHHPVGEPGLRSSLSLRTCECDDGHGRRCAARARSSTGNRDLGLGL